ncbi:family 78 glycoside hydrolase catalytic domain [Streptomyces sp. NPDC020996]|uniref:family 78 glycoside hydrolase catalytic domain n=1 Tax=Streptomyces sp. NPDC020996 TaxID=3154791 RepID=UPI0033DE4009
MSSTRPTHLRVDHLDRPLGTSEPRPRLSWRLPRGATRQLAHRVRAGDWDSGRVDSPVNTYVRYGGPAPASATRTEWRVKVWTDLGESDWSEPSWWETGLLRPDDWRAHWIEPAETEPAAPGHRPAHLLRHGFGLGRPVRTARVHATAHGVYELFLNGHRVGDAELTPGFTSYRSRLQVQTYDVTGLLATGDNAIGAVLSDGWFRGRHGFAREADGFGTRTALLVQLVVTHTDGTRTTIGTGTDWRSARGAVLAADLMDGQHTDLRAYDPRWADPGFDDGGWDKARPAEGGLYADLTRLTGPIAPPVRRVAEIRPVRVSEPRPGRHVVDLGQNINGWVRLSGLGPAGTRLTLVHGEVLDQDGDVTTDNIRAFDWATRRPLPAGQVDTVVSAGRAGEVFEPRHTTHGFRYVRVEGHPGPLTADDVTGVVVHTDLTRTGWFTCSDARVDRLHEAAVWSLRGNACDVPTDCPQRERAAWTGDWQVFVPTAAFLYDVAGFTAKWLRDLAADQWADGVVPNFVPDPAGEAGRRASAEGGLNGSAGWGDAAVIVPWEIYRAYGDLDLLREQYPSMRAWVEYAAGQARTRRHPDRAAARPHPAAHEEFLWDTGFHFGEWLEPGVAPDLDPARDRGDVATAYLFRSAGLLARVAALLGHRDDATRYRRVADGARAAWRHEYLTADGATVPDTQATLVRALAFGLVPPHLRPRAADRLAELVRAAGTQLSTGFLSTALLLPVLADHGHLDLAYELLLRDTPPSWLAMIDKGATTIWEDWEGTDEHGRPKMSYNHYSKGAVVSFLHQCVAGIRLPDDPVDCSVDPDDIAAAGAGYRRFVVAPRPGGGLTSASARHDCPHGTIRSAWERHGDSFALTVEVPPGTEAEVRLPGGTRTVAGPGVHRFDAHL